MKHYILLSLATVLMLNSGKPAPQAKPLAHGAVLADGQEKKTEQKEAKPKKKRDRSNSPKMC